MSGSSWFIARAQARRRWRALVLLTLFVGLIGGLSLSLIAGSRRSSSAVDRYLAAARHYDFEVYAPWLTRAQIHSVASSVRADPSAYLGMVSLTRSGRQGGGINGLVVDFRAADPTARILAGRLPDGSPSQIAVNESFVKEFGHSVGDVVDVRMFARDQEDQISKGQYHARGPRYRFRIAALVRAPNDIAGDEVRSPGANAYGGSNAMFVPEAFYDAHRHDFLDFGEAFDVELARGTSRAEFVSAVNARRPAGADELLAAPIATGERHDALATPVALETNALLALGAGLAVVGAIAVALVLRAEQRVHDDDIVALRTLGATAPQLGYTAVLRCLPVAVIGCLVALTVAVALSPRYPIGIGHEIELSRGLDVNVAVLALGALAIIMLTLGASFLFGRPRRQHDGRPTSRLTMARWLGRAGAPTDLVLGTQLAFERGRGVRAVPSRQAVAAGAAALALVTAVAVYVAGVDHLYEMPAAHGWPWDAVIGNVNFPLAARTARRLGEDRRIAHETLAKYGDAKVDGRPIELLAFDARGDAPPEVVAGRLPRTASEIALGRGTLDQLGKGLGSTVRFSVAGGELAGDGPMRTRTMSVVGEALPPILGESDLGHVGAVTLGGVAAAGGDATGQLVLVDMDRGHRSEVTAINRDYTEEIVTDAVPAEIVNLHRVRRLPVVGLLLAGLLGTIVLTYTLAISARARARELAVLRALGMPARRLRRVLAWQGFVLGAGIVVFGLPVGLALGSSVWNRVADGLGVEHGAVITPLVYLLAPMALLVGVVASLYPSRRARRAPVASLLHAE